MKLKRALSTVLAFTTLTISTFSTIGTANAVEVETKDTPQASSAQLEAEPSISSTPNKDIIKNGSILHAWCWDFKTITENIPLIAKAGYTAVQTSPVSKCYDKYQVNSNGKKVIMGTDESGGTDGCWWWHYQPTELSIGNYQLGGSDPDKWEQEYQEMCTTAHEYGVKIITDVVINHTVAHCILNPETNKEYAIEADQRFDITQNYLNNIILPGEDWHTLYHKDTFLTKLGSTREQTINYCQIGLPDVDTENSRYQAYLVKYLKALKENGCDGFRFDMASNVGIDSDSSIDNRTYNFWKVVTGQTQVKDINNNTVVWTTSDTNDMFYYGEILGQDEKKKVNEYTNYISVTASDYGYQLRETNLKGKNLNSSSVSNWQYSSSVLSPDKMVTWVESHDTYTGDHQSAYLTSQQIRLGWAIIAARNGGTPLFFSRPDGSNGSAGNYWGNNVLGARGNDEFFSPEVVAVNHFRNAMVGENEYLRNINNNSQLLQIDRGTKGTCIINISDNDYDIDTVTNLAVGTYKDSVTGNIFEVYANGNSRYIKGHIERGRVAVIYEKVKESDIIVDGQVSFEGNYIGKTYSTSDVTLTNKNRLQFTLNLTEEQINNNYSNVLAFTAFKYGDTWKISDNCVAYQNGVPTTVLMWNINE